MDLVGIISDFSIACSICLKCVINVILSDPIFSKNGPIC